MERHQAGHAEGRPDGDWGPWTSPSGTGPEALPGPHLPPPGGLEGDLLPTPAPPGDHVKSGSLSSPEAFADFAVQCKEEYGYPAFKIHGWGKDPADGAYIEREALTVLETRKRVGPAMDRCWTPPAEYDTWETLKVGKACDEADFFWYEDPSRTGASRPSRTRSCAS